MKFSGISTRRQPAFELAGINSRLTDDPRAPWILVAFAFFDGERGGWIQELIVLGRARNRGQHRNRGHAVLNTSY